MPPVKKIRRKMSDKVPMTFRLRPDVVQALAPIAYGEVSETVETILRRHFELPEPGAVKQS